MNPALKHQSLLLCLRSCGSFVPKQFQTKQETQEKSRTFSFCLNAIATIIDEYRSLAKLLLTSLIVDVSFTRKLADLREGAICDVFCALLHIFHLTFAISHLYAFPHTLRGLKADAPELINMNKNTFQRFLFLPFPFAFMPNINVSETLRSIKIVANFPISIHILQKIGAQKKLSVWMP